MSLIEISEQRFRALFYLRDPYIKNFTEEVKWFSSEDESVLITILYCHIDKDYNAIILKRDHRNIFRCFDAKSSYQDLGELEMILRAEVSKYLATNLDENIGEKPFELFDVKYPKDKLDSAFHLLTLGRYKGAKKVIEELAYTYIDLDGVYIRDFQTKGFNARLWELYLYAFLKEQDFTLSTDFSSPDFSVSKGPFNIHIEATTINPPDGEDYKEKSPEEVSKLLEGAMQYKFIKALNKKLRKKVDGLYYWEKEHVKGNPFIIAIHDHFSPKSMTWSRTALMEGLYGYKPEVKNGKSVLKSVSSFNGKSVKNFFGTELSQNVSAVIFSNSATIPKFDRLGRIAGYKDPNVKTMNRVGTKYNPDPNAFEPIPFMDDVDDPKYKETWSNGVTIYHNPQCKYPLKETLFNDDVAEIRFIDGEVCGYIPEGFIFSSVTHYGYVKMPQG